MKLRLLGAGLAAAVALALAPAVAVVTAPAASAAGDVCDICSVNFDLRLCEELGGWAYDSTQEPAPPAISGGTKPQQPAPEQPAPQQPAAPQEQAPQAPVPQAPAQQPSQPQTGTKTPTGTKPQTGTQIQTQTGSGQTAPVPGTADVVTDATAPAAPTGLDATVSGRSLTLSWQVPADGGSPLTAYKLVLNGGAPIEVPADATSYDIELGDGSYEVALIASNAIGDSPASATLTGIEVTASPSPSPSQTTEGAVLAASTSSGTTPLAGGLVLGGIVLAAGGLLAWWWLRRRATTVPGANASASVAP